jgi:ribosomal protein S18 acetylase RimI-like enzyme
VAARTAPNAVNRAERQARTAVLRTLTDREQIRTRLRAAPVHTAYALGYLDRRLTGFADFYEASIGDRWAVVMHARGGLGTSTLTVGDPDALRALMRLHPGPRQTFLTCEPQHVETLLKTHNLWRAQTMMRMQVDRDSFIAAPARPGIRRLIDADAADLNRLYSIEGDGIHYTGRQVGEGVYYGAYVRARIVAAAGTHIHSLGESVAVIGNVFTHPDFRGHGLGSAVTGAVAEHLLKVCDLVVLNVDPANRTARFVYDSLGFREVGRLIEAMATRRETTTPMPLVRRFIARVRSRTPGLEVVRI